MNDQPQDCPVVQTPLGARPGRQRRFSTLRLGLISLVAIALTSCAELQLAATVDPYEEIRSVPDKAVFVVVQPRLKHPFLSLLDQHGNIVGQIHEPSHAVVELPPGPFRLYLTHPLGAHLGDRVEGKVDAGKIYFATVSTSYPGIRLNALNPRSVDQRWSHREAWIRNTPRLRLDPEKVPEVAERLGDTASILSEIDQKIERMSEAHREERRVRAEDGL